MILHSKGLKKFENLYHRRVEQKIVSRVLLKVVYFLLPLFYFFSIVIIIIVWLLGEFMMSYRIIGAVLIVAGLYFVLWGKSEERKFAREQLAIASSTDHSIIRPASHAKASLAQPLLSSSTENV